MLNLRHLASAYNDRTRSYAELLPWFKDITPGLVLNLDGSLLAVFEYQGHDVESSNDDERGVCLDAVDIAWRAFDEHNTVWTFLDKRRKQYGGTSSIANPVARFVDDTWRARIDNGQLGAAILLAALVQEGPHRVVLVECPPRDVDGIEAHAAFVVVRAFDVVPLVLEHGQQAAVEVQHEAGGDVLEPRQQLGIAARAVVVGGREVAQVQQNSPLPNPSGRFASTGRRTHGS